MTTFDLSPLYRSVIGLDRMANMIDSVSHGDNSGYPPYNIEHVDENDYRISMAVAGFDQSELDIEVKENNLTVRGEKSTRDEEKNYLHRGIAERNFERRFQLADYVKVENASVENGLLHIDLKREVPEAAKPRKIQIGSQKAKLIDAGKDAA